MILYCVGCHEKLHNDVTNKKGNTWYHCDNCYRTQLSVDSNGKVVYYSFEYKYKIIGSKEINSTRWLVGRIADNIHQIDVKFIPLRVDNLQKGYDFLLSRIEKLSRFQ